MTTRFFRIQLRTLDVAAARAFYDAVLGGGPLPIVQLHEQAVARGARPHWLGHLSVDQVDRASAAFQERGAVPLGPIWKSPEGLEASVLRDPGGAIVSVAKLHPPGLFAEASPDVLWHLLFTNDVERAKANYAQLFGWEFAPPLDLGAFGVFHPFAWEAGGPTVGSMGDLAGRPGVHPQWTHYVRVPSLDGALDAVRANGGTHLEPITLSSGARIGVCDDPQGAAFSLREEPR